MNREPCDGCGLHRKKIPGEGPLTSPVIFIGEAPGETEERLGRPFVGRSGQLLRRIMNKVGIDPASVYITNIVKCRPPNNRVPTMQEIKACKPQVLGEIESIDPSLIVFVGSTSMKGITGLRPNMELETGRIFDWKGRRCTVIYHPAWVLRDLNRIPILERQLLVVANEIGKQPTGLDKWA